MITNTMSITAEIQYLLRDPNHDDEKPYFLYYAYGDSIPRTNTINDRREMPVHNARGIKLSAKEMFFEYGFAKMELVAELSQHDYFDPLQVKEALYPKCRAIVRSLFPDAARVEVLEHGSRRRDPQYPASGLERHEYSQNQPSDYVHIDYTSSSAEKSAKKQFGIEPEKYSRTIAINLWKPINGPVYDWPLTLCDRRTVDHARQTISMDVVNRDYVNENTRIYYDEAHRWYYWEGLTNDEVIVFMQSDSEAKDEAGVPHTAFDYSRHVEKARCRQSVEVRVFAFFD